MRRYTLRIDDFVSANAPLAGGEPQTKPVRVEMQDEQGKPLPGFTLEDCDVLYGNTLDSSATWHRNPDVSSPVGTVRLRFLLQDADLSSYQFGQ